MDEFDRRLLALLQRDNRRTYDDLGSELGLSATAVRRRATRLREAGVIAALAGRVEAARASFESVVALDPASPQAQTARNYLEQLAE